MLDPATLPIKAIRILIEGPDLAGKSTIASSLVEHLQNGNHRVDHLKGKYSRRSWNQVLRRLDANRFAQSNLLNSLYIASAVLDKLTRTADAAAPIVICESYVDRAIAYGTSLQRNPIARVASHMPWLFPRFELVVLLTCSYELRLERLASRTTPTRIDRMTCDSPQTHDRFVSAYQRALRRHDNLLTFDTGRIAIDVIVRHIACQIDRLVSHSLSQKGY